MSAIFFHIKGTDMNTSSKPDSGIDAKVHNNGRRGFLGTLGGLAVAATALPLLSANRAQADAKPQPAPTQEPIQGNAFFD